MSKIEKSYIIILKVDNNIPFYFNVVELESGTILKKEEEMCVLSGISENSWSVNCYKSDIEKAKLLLIDYYEKILRDNIKKLETFKKRENL